MAGCATTPPLPSYVRGWDRACVGAPHQQLSPQVIQGLRQAGVIAGHRGWQPDVQWVNDQCRVLGRQ